MINSLMPLPCNIDSRGKRARLIYGIVLMIIGLVLLFAWAMRSGGVWAWVVTAVCLAGGAFAIFEARVGWCAVRAMGWRTPM